jgi:hypothetical protein
MEALVRPRSRSLASSCKIDPSTWVSDAPLSRFRPFRASALRRRRQSLERDVAPESHVPRYQLKSTYGRRKRLASVGSAFETRLIGRGRPQWALG